MRMSSWVVFFCATLGSFAETRTLQPLESLSLSIPAQPQPAIHELTIHTLGARLHLEIATTQLHLASGRATPTSFCWIATTAQSLTIRSLEKSETRSFEFTLNSRPATPADDPRAVGCQLRAQAGDYFDATSPDLAKQQLATLQAALVQFETAADLPRQAEIHTALGRTYFNLNNPRDGLAAHQKAVDLWRRAALPDGQARAAAILGLAYSATNQLPLARSTFESALKLARDAGDKSTEAATLTRLAQQPAREGRTSAAFDLCEQALKLVATTGDRATQAEVENDYAILLQNASQLEAAQAHYQRALELRRQIEDEIGQAQVLNNLATVASRLGDPLDAIAILENVLEIRRRLSTPQAVANTQHNLATEYALKGDFDKALQLFEAALPVWRASANKFGEAATLTELAGLYGRMNLPTRSETAFHQALALQRELKNLRGESASLSGLGLVQLRLHRYAEAEPLLRAALQAARRGKFSLEEARALSALGNTLSRLGRHSEAIDHLTQAAALAANKNQNDLLAIQISLGAAHLRYSDPTTAIPILRQALADSLEIENTFEEIGARATLAEALLAARQLDEARTQITTAADLADKQLLKVVGDDLRAQSLDRLAGVYQLGANIYMHAGQPQQALRINERGRARLLFDLLTKADAAATADPALLEQQSRLRASINAKADRLTRLLIARATPAQTNPVRKQISDLLAAHSGLQARIARDDPRHAALAAPASLEAVQRKLKPGQALLEFSLGPTDSYLWTVTHDAVHARNLGPNTPIEAASNQLRGALASTLLQDPSESPTARQQRLAQSQLTARSAAARLSSLLFPKGLPAYNRLYLVPDGALHYTPFSALNTLRVPELITLPSAAILAELPSPTPPSTIAVFADPVYDLSDTRLPASTTRTPAENLRFPRLRFSKQEADSVAALTLPTKRTISTGFEANRQAASQLNRARFDILHFATHAHWNHQTPQLSGVVLSMFDAQGRPTDGFLRLHDIAQWRLNRHLIVLSACETALGERLNGEGLMGLSRAFLAAGASGVVATLWPVDDAATAAFMKAFYHALLRQHLSPPAALRAAQRAIQNQPQWANPFYWAGFTYSGA